MSLDVEALRVYVRVADLRSFTKAASQLRMPKARASAHVQRLEGQLGTQLLQRSTRVVHLTPEGEQLLERARGFLTQADEIGSLFHTAPTLRGRVRLELPPMIARDFVIPRLPELLLLHPHLQLDISGSDRLVAALQEGFDLVLRVGPVVEAGLVGRRIGEAKMMNWASPSYLRKHGIPQSIEDLREHTVVHYAADANPSFEYFDGRAFKDLPMKSVLTVDNFDAYEAAGLAGLGIVQLPHPGHERYADKLVQILPELVARPVPITVLHTHGRSVPRRVRAVMNWLVEVLTPIVRDLVKAG